jgi:D-xylose transport system ATP-binding protein
LAPRSRRQGSAAVVPLAGQEGLGIFLISHDIHDVFDLSDRISVMLTGKLVGTVDKGDVTKDEVLAMIIMGKQPGEVSDRELAEFHG